MRTNIKATTAASVLLNMLVILSFIGMPELPGAARCPDTSQEAMSAPRNL